jgi:hypothetical protein
VRARLAYYQGWIRSAGFELISKASPCFREGLRLFREADHREGVAICLAQLIMETCEVRYVKGTGASVLPTPEARRFTDECLAIARQLNDFWVLAYCLSAASRAAPGADVRRARLEESVALARTTGDPFLLTQTIWGLSTCLLHQGNLASSRELAQEALDTSRKLDDKASLLKSLDGLAASCINLGAFREAHPLLEEAIDLAVETGARPALAYLVGLLDVEARGQGRLRRAARFNGAAVSFLFDTIPLDEIEKAGRHSSLVTGLDEETTRAEFRAGLSMTIGQIKDYAFSEA